MAHDTKILLVDDKESVLELLATILENYDLARASDGAQALHLLDSQAFDVVVTDIRMPGADGHAVLGAVKRSSPETAVVMLTAYATVPDAVAAVKQGAYDYIEKPFDPDDLALTVARAADHRRRAAQADAAPAGSGSSGVSVPYREAVEAARDRASREYLAALMREYQGCVTWAADRAGMDRVSLHRLLRRFGIRSEEFKNTALPAGAATPVRLAPSSVGPPGAAASAPRDSANGDERTASKARVIELPAPNSIAS